MKPFGDGETHDELVRLRRHECCLGCERSLTNSSLTFSRSSGPLVRCQSGYLVTMSPHDV
jgi:hypothetical protein